MTATVLIHYSSCPNLWTAFCKNGVLVKDSFFSEQAKSLEISSKIKMNIFVYEREYLIRSIN